MERQVHYLISDAAKQVEVESHVLRYWEEELGIPIKRNELGHRYYTKEDVECFKEIKNLKQQGLQLKAIRMVVKDGKFTRLKSNAVSESIMVYGMKSEKESDNKRRSYEEEKKEIDEETAQGRQMIEIIGSKDLSDPRQANEELSALAREEKGMRLQILLQHMIAEAVKEGNKELCDEIKESVLKEMDYQFRLQEEREEVRSSERLVREDEHYKRIDELLRSYSKKKHKKEGEKQSRFGARKKPSIV